MAIERRIAIHANAHSEKILAFIEAEKFPKNVQFLFDEMSVDAYRDARGYVMLRDAWSEEYDTNIRMSPDGYVLS